MRNNHDYDNSSKHNHHHMQVFCIFYKCSSLSNTFHLSVTSNIFCIFRKDNPPIYISYMYTIQLCILPTNGNRIFCIHSFQCMSSIRPIFLTYHLYGQRKDLNLRTFLSSHSLLSSSLHAPSLEFPQLNVVFHILRSCNGINHPPLPHNLFFHKTHTDIIHYSFLNRISYRLCILLRMSSVHTSYIDSYRRKCMCRILYIYIFRDNQHVP